MTVSLLEQMIKRNVLLKKKFKEALDTCVLTHDALDLNAQTV